MSPLHRNYANVICIEFLASAKNLDCLSRKSCRRQNRNRRSPYRTITSKQTTFTREKCTPNEGVWVPQLCFTSPRSSEWSGSGDSTQAAQMHCENISKGVGTHRDVVHCFRLALHLPLLKLFGPAGKVEARGAFEFPRVVR